MKTVASVCQIQCDQIGRIFAKWAIVYFGRLFKILEVTHIFGLIYSTVKVTYALILWKNVLGYTLGDF
jgi:hypothetical protein